MQDRSLKNATLDIMSKLKIYACNGVGNADNRLTYWTDNTLSENNTQAVNNLLSMINFEYAKVVNLDLSEDETLDRLDNIDLYCVCMRYAQEYSNNREELHRAGQVIGELVESGVFECDLLSNDERDVHLDSLFDVVEQAMKSGKQTKGNVAFMEWWHENVEELNSIGLSKSQQTAVRKLMKKDGSVGDVDSADLNKYLNDAGEYFLYTYFTEEQLEALPYVFRRKANYQKNLYQYCRELYIKQNGTEQSMQNIIRAGIIDLMKCTPEKACENIYTAYVESNKQGVGALTEAAIASITVVLKLIVAIASLLSVVGGIITTICNAVVACHVADQSSVDDKYIKDQQPAPEDYNDLDLDSINNNKNYLAIGAAVLALLLLLKR